MSSVLVADDHRFFRSGVEAALLARGYSIVGSVSDGDTALEAIKEKNPDLVLLDVRMPKLDGVSTLEKLRARKDGRPVIVLAAEITDRDLVRLMKAKVDSIVFKHEGEAPLFDAIKAVESGSRHISGELLDRAFSASAAESSHTKTLEALSPKEREIAALVGLGQRNREIGDRLGLKEGSVKVYLHNIYNKLGITNRTELALLVRELN